MSTSLYHEPGPALFRVVPLWLAGALLLGVLVGAPMSAIADNPQSAVVKSLASLRARQEAIESRQSTDKAQILDRTDALNTRITDTNNTIASINTSLVGFGILVTILGLAVGFFAIRSAEGKAREAARDSAEAWMHSHEHELRREADAQAHTMRTQFDSLKADVIARADAAKLSMAAAVSDTERTHRETEEHLQSLLDAGSSIASRADRDILDSTEQTLKDKPEANYSATDWITRGLAAYAENEMRLASEYFNKASNVPDASQYDLGRALINEATMLARLGRETDSLAIYDDVIARFKDVDDSGLRSHYARAMVNKGIILENLGADEQALPLYEAVIIKFGDSVESDVRAQVARALFNKGDALSRLGFRDEALASYHDALARFEDATESQLRKHVINTLIKLSIALYNSERYADSLSCSDNALGRGKNEADSELRTQIATALYMKGIALEKLNRDADATAAFNNVIAGFNDAPERSVRAQLAKAMLRKGHILSRAGRHDDARSTYSDLIARFFDDPFLSDEVERARNASRNRMSTTAGTQVGDDLQQMHL